MILENTANYLKMVGTNLDKEKPFIIMKQSTTQDEHQKWKLAKLKTQSARQDKEYIYLLVWFFKRFEWCFKEFRVSEKTLVSTNRPVCNDENFKKSSKDSKHL